MVRSSIHTGAKKKKKKKKGRRRVASISENNNYSISPVAGSTDDILSSYGMYGAESR